MNIKQAICRWTKFRFEYGPVYTLDEIKTAEPPNGSLNGCNVFSSGRATVVIHDDKRSFVGIQITKFEGIYYVSSEGEDVYGNCGGFGSYPSRDKYSNPDTDKMKAILK